MAVAVDTGPLVALLNARDEHHEWAREMFDRIEPPLLTCEAVLTEACYLVRGFRGGPSAVLDLVARRVLDPSFAARDQAHELRHLMTKFASVPMSFADACLVRMTELDARVSVMTLDADFGIYRKLGRQRVPVFSPAR